MIALALCFAGIFQHGLWTPDEPREAEVGREMLVSHFSAMPTLSGEAFLEKPPLFAWITAASFKVLGVSPGAARVPAALLAVGTMLVTYLLGKYAAGRLAGLCSAVALGTTWQFAETSHKAVLDVALAFFVAAGHLCFLRLRSRAGPGPYVGIAVLSGLAFLTKSWIGVALLCVPPVLASVALREWGVVWRVLPRAALASVLGIAAIGGPWVLALAHTPGGGWDAVKECLVTEYVGRSVGGEEFGKRGHANPPWYYLSVVPVVLAPWVLALPATMKSRTLDRTWRGGRTLWLALVFATAVLLLSIPSGKRDLYLLPLTPAAAAVFGTWLSRLGSRRGGPWDRVTTRVLTTLGWGVIVLVVACVVALTFVSVPRAWAPTETVDALRDGLRPFGIAATVIGLVAVVTALWRRRSLGGAASPIVRTAWPLVLVFLLLHGAVRTLLDPVRDMERGAREVSALVPSEEGLLAFSADETTLAVIPFHTERYVANAEGADDALRLLQSGVSRHLIVMDKDVKKMGPALSARVELVKSVRLSATRDVNVYAYRP